MKSRFLPLMVSLLVAGVLVLLVRDFLHQVIVTPILYVSWIATLTLGSFRQEFYWVAFIVVALVIATKSLARGNADKRTTRSARYSNRGPVATWFALVARSETQEFSRWRLAQALKRLAREILTPGGTFNLHNYETERERYVTDLPPEVEAYFEAPLPWSQRALAFWHRFRATKRSTGLDLDPEMVVEFLESRVDPFAGEP